VQGRVKWFDPKKGYGFVAGEDGKDYFVYWSEIQMPGYKTLEAGQEVEFSQHSDTRGERAVRVKPKPGRSIVEREHQDCGPASAGTWCMLRRGRIP